ncbi:MAG TPA: MFS transporter [Solirubrobacterales bacterium]|nr:MFS transporter [Solirubrobacterales bacterium]
MSATHPAGANQRPGLSFAGVFAATFCGLVGVGSVLPVLPRYIHGPLDSGDVAVGIVIGAYAVTGLLLRPVAGRLADTRGRKPTLLVGACLVALSGLLYLPGLGIAGLIVARLILGAGEGAVYTSGSAWIVDLAPEDRRGRVLGLYGLAVWGGLSVGPLLGEVLLDAGGYDLVWIVAGALPVVGALFALAARDPFVPLAHAEPHPLIAPEAIGPGFAVGLASFGYAAVATFIVLHLESRGVGHGATVFAAFAAMIVLTRLVFGDLPDRMGAAPVAIAATVGEALGLALIAVADSLPVALLGGCLMGGAFALLNPSLMLIALGRVSQQARGAAMGTYTAFFDAGVGLGAPIAGAVAALTSYEGAFFFAAAVCLASALLVFVRLHPSGPAAPGPS